MSDQVDLHGMLYALRLRMIAEMSESRRLAAFGQIDRLQGKAAAYVWGREDQSGVKIREAYGRELIDASWEFGHMIGIEVAMSYLCGYPWRSEMSLRDAFAAFTAGRDTWDYVDSRWPS